MCDVVSKQIKENLDNGAKRFDKLDKKLEENNTALSEIKTSIALISQKIDKKNNGNS